ncbi:MAG: permease [Chloroflexota bacterium]
MDYLLYILAGIALLVSLLADRRKTLRALKITVKRLLNIMPAFLVMLVLVSVVLFLLPGAVISRLLGNNNLFLSTGLAALMGSIALIPGFIAYPLGGILLNEGVPYTVIAAFTVTLMMVGVLTAPVEKAYFGLKLTVIRNGISFLIALVVAVVIGIYFGEILL